MKRKQLLHLSIIFLLIPFSSLAQKDSVDIWISRIDNSSLAGTCHYVWVIEPTVKEVYKLINTGKPAEEKLAKLVSDENKGIVAHYILSNIHRETTYKIFFDSLAVTYIYNGLEFIETNGVMHVNKIHLEKCKEEWISKIREKKKSK